MKKIFYLFTGIITTLLVIAIFYFSWLPNPDLGAQVPMPVWLDVFCKKFGNFRTAIPTFLLAICWIAFLKSGAIHKKFLHWFIVPISALLVLTAELGQLFMPRRSFDWRDIFWGIAGSFAGWLLWLIWDYRKWIFFKPST